MNPHDPNYWALQGDQARMATQGINQMPGVFSNYGAIPAPPPNTDINTEEGWLRTNYPGHADLQPGGKYGGSDNDSRVRNMFFPGTGKIGVGGGSPLQQMIGGGQDTSGLLGGPAPNTLLGMGLAGLLAQPSLIGNAITGNINPLTGKPLTPEESALVSQAAAQLGTTGGSGG
jgi:hypothetical protein